MTNTSETTRTERDSLGVIAVPKDALYGAQTQRAVNNFHISGQTLPAEFIQAIALIKKTAAKANQSLKLLPDDQAAAIGRSAEQIIEGDFPGTYQSQFPIDVYQTGSATSSNMNVNEVIAHLAKTHSDTEITANDHVNMGQSSNDVIPSAIHISAALLINHQLLPALDHLISALNKREQELNQVVKTGRTHLMDAMPVTFGQEISGWKALIQHDRIRLTQTLDRLYQLTLGGTAVGTGTNTHSEFAHTVCKELSNETLLPFNPADNFFAAQSVPASALELSSVLRSVATSLTKIANDLRWMNSGPLAGLGEIELPILQPGSSIMPGKINPVISESVLMVAAQINGLDTAITMGAQSGNFELNVMLPMIGNNLISSLKLASNAANTLADKAISGFKVKTQNIDSALYHNPVLVTALNPVIGYMKAAEIAKLAYSEQRPILDVAIEKTGMSKKELSKLLDPLLLTEGGISKSPS
ncbi:aspartate ammonia-lyase [Endozoicomonas sp. (ex Bugula neritina AB1)]|nr:aspartate ammonia-lyase [Endozoicomonas sp. (ex Bugula neritina AB1)]